LEERRSRQEVLEERRSWPTLAVVHKEIFGEKNKKNFKLYERLKLDFLKVWL
jgi:hypothetical protein